MISGCIQYIHARMHTMHREEGCDTLFVVCTKHTVTFVESHFNKLIVSQNRHVQVKPITFEESFLQSQISIDDLVL